MTYGYGSTDFGMSKQVYEELAERGISIAGKGKDVRRFAEDVRAAIKDRIPKAEKFYEFLRLLAETLSAHNEILKWDTPSGVPFANRYSKPNTERIDLVLQGVSFQRTVADGHKDELDADEATSGAAPNIVHALDAAHLARTVNACASNGIRDLMTVHDCFACLVPQADKLNQIVRYELWRMYEEHDPLVEIRERALIPLGPQDRQLIQRKVPTQGKFDIREVLKSAFSVV